MKKRGREWTILFPNPTKSGRVELGEANQAVVVKKISSPAQRREGLLLHQHYFFPLLHLQCRLNIYKVNFANQKKKNTSLNRNFKLGIINLLRERTNLMSWEALENS